MNCFKGAVTIYMCVNMFTGTECAASTW